MTEIWALAALWVGLALVATDAVWIKYLSSAGAIVLTFLAGTELDPSVSKQVVQYAGKAVLVVR